MNNNFINRELGKTLLDAANYFPVLCVTGPRQSGKSTLVTHLFPEYKQVSLEDIDVRAAAMDDPRGFLNQTSGGMIIDEVQRVPELLSYIQGIVDNDSERRFILSGSSNFALLRSVSQSLAGRTGMFELLPMAFSEVREGLAMQTLDEILFNGLYPAICAEKNTARFLYPSYVKTYLERDVRDLLQVRNLMQFNTFLRCFGTGQRSGCGFQDDHGLAIHPANFLYRLSVATLFCQHPEEVGEVTETLLLRHWLGLLPVGYRVA